MNTVSLAENGVLPYWLIRKGIRSRLGKKLRSESSKGENTHQAFKESLRESDIATDTEKANEQHYELPAAFFQRILGPHLKYSSAYWPEECENLAEAERASLAQVAERAQLRDGQIVLDMGCGWGSFSLWAAEKYRSSQFLAVSNSNTQREFIEELARSRGILNLKVVTCDINEFQPGKSFDRIVSIEMLEHARNYDQLFERVASWLKPEGRFFAHVFSHRKYSYPYKSDDPSEWMARYFFTGGIMPGHDLLPSFNRSLSTIDSWQLSGEHYCKTAEAWLENFDDNAAEIREVFVECYGPEKAKTWMWRWRLFILACAELFGYKSGVEWGVSHYLFSRKEA